MNTAHPLQQASQIALRRQVGATLIELSLVSVIIVTLGVVLLQFQQAASTGFSTIRAQGALRMQLAQVLNAVSDDAAATYQRLPSCCSGAYTEDTDGPIFTLILQVPSLDSSGNTSDPAVRSDSIIYQFDQATGRLQRIVERDPGSSRPNATRTVANDLTQFLPLPPAAVWTGTSNNRLRLELQAQRTEERRLYTEPREAGTLKAEFALRNWPH